MCEVNSVCSILHRFNGRHALQMGINSSVLENLIANLLSVVSFVKPLGLGWFATGIKIGST